MIFFGGFSPPEICFVRHLCKGVAFFYGICKNNFIKIVEFYITKAIFVKRHSAMKFRILSISLFLILVINPLRSQTTVVDSSILQMADWVKALNIFGRFNTQEKVYFHLDNKGY